MYWLTPNWGSHELNRCTSSSSVPHLDNIVTCRLQDGSEVAATDPDEWLIAIGGQWWIHMEVYELPFRVNTRTDRRWLIQQSPYYLTSWGRETINLLIFNQGCNIYTCNWFWKKIRFFYSCTTPPLKSNSLALIVKKFFFPLPTVYKNYMKDNMCKEALTILKHTEDQVSSGVKCGGWELLYLCQGMGMLHWLAWIHSISVLCYPCFS